MKNNSVALLLTLNGLFNMHYTAMLITHLFAKRSYFACFLFYNSVCVMLAIHYI